MRVLVLGGTHFLGRHVVDAALRRGHDVATFTRGVSGAPPPGVRALHGDRDDPDALPAALAGWTPQAVVDTSAQTRAAAENAARVLDHVGGYAFVSSVNAYRDWPDAGVREDSPLWDSPDEAYGPVKAHAERVLRAALGPRLLSARAGLIIGPHDPEHRLGWWLRRIARGGPTVVPAALEQPVALVDARDLAGWLVDCAVGGTGGTANATGPAGMTTLGGLLEICREVTGGDAHWVPVPERVLVEAGVRPWVQLPYWLPQAMARTAWDVDTTRARGLGLPSRPLATSVADTWAWLRGVPDPPAGTGLPAELEAHLLATTGTGPS